MEARLKSVVSVREGRILTFAFVFVTVIGITMVIDRLGCSLKQDFNRPRAASTGAAWPQCVTSGTALGADVSITIDALLLAIGTIDTTGWEGGARGETAGADVIDVDRATSTTEATGVMGDCFGVYINMELCAAGVHVADDGCPICGRASVINEEPITSVGLDGSRKIIRFDRKGGSAGRLGVVTTVGVALNGKGCRGMDCE